MATGNGWARVRLQLLLLPLLLLGLGLRARAAVGDRIQSVGPLEPTAGCRWLRDCAAVLPLLLLLRLFAPTHRVTRRAVRFAVTVGRSAVHDDCLAG